MTDSQKGSSKIRYDHSVSEYANDNILDYNTKSKVELYNEAIKDFRFITGDVREDKQIAMKADWAHLEFMAAAHKKEILYYMSKDHWQGLKAFWGCLWKYIEKVLKDYKAMSDSYHNLLSDSDWMIKNHSELKIEADFFDEYVKKEMTNEQRMAYRHWYKKKKEILDEKLEAIRTEEGKKAEEQRIKDSHASRSKSS